VISRAIGLAILAHGVTIVSAGTLAQTAPPATRAANASAASAVPSTSPSSEGATPRRRLPDTLMFTIDEFNEIKDRIAGGEITNEQKQEALGVDALFLGSIMYYGPKDWTIWINGSPIGPDQDFQAFQVTDIGPRFVELLVPLSVQGMRPVRLEPNQTFIAESGIIVEGKYP
jgi:hypothetical protein